jgi:ATP-dependent Clp protease ATP-binding subunit ClpA
VREYLAENGYDPNFGARPLKRLIQHEVENKLAEEMLEGKLLPGHRYLISVKNKQISVTRDSS